MWRKCLNIIVDSQRNLIQKSYVSTTNTVLNEAKRSFAGSKSRYNQSKGRNNNGEIIRISNLNSRGGAYRKFRVSPTALEENEDFEATRGISERVDLESFEKFNEDLDLYSKSEEAYHTKIIDEDIRERRRTKTAIIMKKIAKLEGHGEERDFNLLTWDAKEQIKHLHLNDPETWTAEKIAESFPITVEGCRRLLKSKWVPRTMQQIADHDEIAMNNWKKLRKDEGITGGPPVNMYKELIKSNMLNLMKHAAGIPGIDFERKATLNALKATQESNELIYKPGPFTKIIEKKPPKNKNIPSLIYKKLESLKQQNTNDDELKTHLETTKIELSKCFSNIFKDETSSIKANNHHYIEKTIKEKFSNN